MGLTEAQAKERGYEINVGRFPFLANGKALGLNERTGWVKVIGDAALRRDPGRPHGRRRRSPSCCRSSCWRRNNELTAAEIARSVHAHPTLSEAMMEAAHAVEGAAIHI